MQNIDFERYKRNIALDEIQKEGQIRLFKAKILVAGCGGLGSFVIMNLAALGIGHLGLLDNDNVEISNLNRQIIHFEKDLGDKKINSAKAKAQAFNSDIKIETFDCRLNKDNYKDIVSDYDLIIDCFDSFQSKFLLNDIALETGKPLIHGGVSGFQGQVMTIIPHKTACLKCLFGNNPPKIQEAKGVIAPTVSLIASYQATEALKHVLNMENTLQNKVLTVNTLSMRSKITTLTANKACVCQK